MGVETWPMFKRMSFLGFVEFLREAWVSPLIDDFVLKLIRAVFFWRLCSVVLLLLDTFPPVVVFWPFLGICNPMKLETVFLLKLIDVWLGLLSFFFGLFLCLKRWMFCLITEQVRFQTTLTHTTRPHIAKNRVPLALNKRALWQVIKITQVSQMKFSINHQHQIQRYSHLNRLILQLRGSEVQGGKQHLCLRVVMLRDHNLPWKYLF